MTILAPTPERSQHGDIVVEPAGRNNKARVYDQPIYDRWAKKGIIDERLRRAAERYVHDSEASGGKLKSCLHRLDRVDNGAMGLVEAHALREAIGRLAAVGASLGPAGTVLMRRVLLDKQSPESVTGKHRDEARGIVVMAFEIMAVAYEKYDKD